MKNKVLILLLTACMILPCFNGLSVTALDTLTDDSVVTPMPETTDSDNVYHKLHFYFDTEAHATIDSAAELQAATASVKADHISAQNTMARSGESAGENVYITVQFASDYLEDETYLELKSDRENAKNALERDIAKRRQNAYSKSYHQALVTENMSMLSAIPYTDFNVIDYSSFVTLTVPASALNTQTLEAIAENENILHISVSGELVAVDLEDEYPSWEEVKQCVNVQELLNDTSNGAFKGQNVRIGVYEAGGVCDANNVNLADKSVTVRSSDADEVAYHATKVASIISIMAPEAEIFSAKVNNSTEGVGWFIEQGCDIVNCSFAYYRNSKNEDGTYSVGYREYRYDIDALYDEQIELTSIMVVVAAGNKSTNEYSNAYNPDNYMASPAHSFNSVVVAGVEMSGDSWVAASRSCYKSNDSHRMPDIAAPYFVTIPNIGISSGTSYSAPIVTAGIALIVNAIDGYCDSSIIQSVLASTAQKTADYSMSLGANRYMDLKVGSGIVDIGKATSSTALFYSGIISDYTEYTNSGNIYTERVCLAKGQEIQIGLSWLAHAEYSPTNEGSVSVTNYYLYLYNYDDDYCTGMAPATSQLFNSNVEMLRFTAPADGFYTIKVTRFEQSYEYEELALTYYINY